MRSGKSQVNVTWLASSKGLRAFSKAAVKADLEALENANLIYKCG